MKNRLVFITIILFISLASRGQIYTKLSSYGYQWNRGIFDIALAIPLQDTTIQTVGLREGFMVYRPANKTVYTWTGLSWHTVGIAVTDSNILGSFTTKSYVDGKFQQIIDDTSLHISNLGYGLIRVDTILLVDTSLIRTTNLPNGKIWVGNASNRAAAVTPSGHVTMTNAGVFSLNNTGVVAGSYGSATLIPTITLDAQGRITAVSTNTISPSGGATTITSTDGSLSVTGTTTVNVTLAPVLTYTNTLNAGHSFTLTATNSHSQKVITDHFAMDTITLAGFTNTSSGGNGKINQIVLKVIQDATGGSGLFFKGTNYLIMANTGNRPPIGTTASSLGAIFYMYYDDDIGKVIIEYGYDYRVGN